MQIIYTSDMIIVVNIIWTISTIYSVIIINLMAFQPFDNLLFVNHPISPTFLLFYKNNVYKMRFIDCFICSDYSHASG